MKEMEIIDPVGYYKNLSKKDKSVLLSYLNVNYGMNSTTMRIKLSGSEHSKLTKLEAITITDVINSGVWRS